MRFPIFKVKWKFIPAGRSGFLPAVVFALLLAGFGLSACDLYQTGDQTESSQEIWLDQQAGLLGQTFTSQFNGLQAVEVFIKPEAVGDGVLGFALYEGPNSSRPLAEGSLPLAEIRDSGFIPLTFPLLPDSASRDLYLELKISGEGNLHIYSGPGDSYLDGSLYQNGQPLDAQLSFRLNYDPTGLLLGLLGETLGWIPPLISGVFLFILPGSGLLAWLWPSGKRIIWPTALALSAGLSLSIYPIIFLWTWVAGVNLGGLYAWIPPLLGSAALLVRLLQTGWRPIRQGVWNWSRSRQVFPDAAFLLVLVLIIITRLTLIRSLTSPLFGDSYQHTMIPQLLADHGGLFSSWQPYTDLITFTYHFGFHAAAAAFSWVLPGAMTDNVLLTGQIINILAVLALYPLGARIGGNRWGGVAALVVGGLLSQHPNFYVNWGRYTQLIGLAILPVFAFLAWDTLRKEKSERGLLILTILTLTGLALSHFRVLFFGLAFIGAFWLIYVRRNNLKPVLWRTFILGIGAGILFLPWFINVAGGQILDIFSGQLGTSAQVASQAIAPPLRLGILPRYLPVGIWILAGVTVLIGLIRRKIGVSLISLWWLIILLLGHPHWIGLPGAGAISQFAVLISLYVPAAILLGGAVGWLASYEFSSFGTKNQGRNHQAALLGIILLASLVGTYFRLNDLQMAAHQLVTRPDLRAMEWIRESIPQGQKFLVNSFFAFQDSVVVGGDAGWWLPLLAGRSTNLPPINYAFEQGPRPDYQEWINALPAAIQSKGVQSSQVKAMLQDRDLDYIYIGQRRGTVNNTGFTLDVDGLLEDPDYELIYQQDRVRIFRFSQE